VQIGNRNALGLHAPPVAEQLVREKGEGRAEDCAGNFCVIQKIETTLNLYTQEDADEARAAQGAFLATVGSSPRRCNELWSGLFRRLLSKSLKKLAGTTRLELATSAVTGRHFHDNSKT